MLVTFLHSTHDLSKVLEMARWFWQSPEVMSTHVDPKNNYRQTKDVFFVWFWMWFCSLKVLDLSNFLSTLQNLQSSALVYATPQGLCLQHPRPPWRTAPGCGDENGTQWQCRIWILKPQPTAIRLYSSMTEVSISSPIGFTWICWHVTASKPFEDPRQPCSCAKQGPQRSIENFTHCSTENWGGDRPANKLQKKWIVSCH